MKTKEEIKEKASEYVDSVRNRIDSYAYLDVQEAFQKGAEWMKEQVNGVETSAEQALNLAVVMPRFSNDDFEITEPDSDGDFEVRLKVWEGKETWLSKEDARKVADFIYAHLNGA